MLIKGKQKDNFVYPFMSQHNSNILHSYFTIQIIFLLFGSNLNLFLSNKNYVMKKKRYVL